MSDVCSSDRMARLAIEDHRLLIVGVDEYDNIWLLDFFWKRTKTDEVVDAMIHMMRKWRPMFWWAEGGHISKSIGPFLFKRMREEKVYVTVVEQTPSADKQTRAQSIQGRMSMGMVHFPNFEPWFEAAHRSEEHTSELQSLMRISSAVFCL